MGATRFRLLEPVSDRLFPQVPRRGGGGGREAARGSGRRAARKVRVPAAGAITIVGGITIHSPMNFLEVYQGFDPSPDHFGRYVQTQ